MPKKTIDAVDVAGRRVLIRVDFNVPLDGATVTDDRRIRMALPTIRSVIDRGGRAILMSHLGRPSGDPAADKSLSLKPVAQRIGKLVGKPCGFVTDCVGGEVEAAAKQLKDGEMLLLENLRFHKAENIIDKAKKNPDKKLTPEQEQKRAAFAEGLAKLGEDYVNDAFGTCHRNHVSMYDVPRLVSGGKAMGFLVEKELEYLGKAVSNPKRPFIAILGGAKVSDKIGVIRSLLGKCDKVLIGGAMMFTFWKAQGRGVGKSLCEDDKLDLARELLGSADAKLVLPSDAIAATELKANVATQHVSGEIPAGLMGLDIGPDSLKAFEAEILKAGTIVWNGPVGAFETKPFDKGTFAIAEAIASATDRGAVTVIGGGDSAAAVAQAGLDARMTHISTGGGASLEFLEGKKFGPIEVLDEA